jgi:kynureninase
MVAAQALYKSIMHFQNSLAFAQELDHKDNLSRFRHEFMIPAVDGKEQIYFLGNSLGLQPKRTPLYVMQVLDQWSHYGVDGFFKGEQPWMLYHKQLVQPLSKIAGAHPTEMVVMNQLTVNLHLMLVSFYQPNETRTKILCESKAFPSDQYMLETHIRQRGLNPDEVLIQIAAPEGEHLIREADILDAIDRNKEELALVFIGGVNYYTGQVFDLRSITEAAHKAGAKAGFDLAHAIGNVSLHLHEWNVDFACWCSYKYLNSGPGAVAGAFVHERYHSNASLPRFAGWWGYKTEKRFLMQPGFEPINSAEGWQLSTPSPVLYATHRAALEIFEEAGMNNLLQKGQQLSNYLLYLIEDINRNLGDKSISSLTPTDESRKGCQVSLLMVDNGPKVFQHLLNNGVYADWREPNVIRVAPVPLYNTFEEVWQFARILLETCATSSDSFSFR